MTTVTCLQLSWLIKSLFLNGLTECMNIECTCINHALFCDNLFHQSTTAKIVVGNKEAASARILIGMQELHNLIPDRRTPKVAFFRAWWYKLRSYIATLMYLELNHYKWYTVDKDTTWRYEIIYSALFYKNFLILGISHCNRDLVTWVPVDLVFFIHLIWMWW